MTSMLRRPITLTLLAAVGVAGVLFVVLGLGHTNSSGPTPAAASVDLASQASATTVVSEVTPVSVAPTTTVRTGPVTTPDMPVTVTVTGTTGVASGDTVSAHVTPTAGSSLYGVEARLCRGTDPVIVDGDFRPTVGGSCIDTPLAAGTDSLVTVAGHAPYGPLDVSFRVGTGSTTFITQSGAMSTVTCDASNPCQIVLKLQYPNGYGFQGVPVTFR